MTVTSEQQSFLLQRVQPAIAIGAGVSMAFSEGLSDTGEVTGRGSPFLTGFLRSFASVALGGAIIAGLSAALGGLAG
jgi:hypothetical protein